MSESVFAPVALIDGTELVGEFRGSGYRDRSMLISRFDGRLVRVPPLLYTVVEALMKRPEALAGSPAAGHPAGVHTLVSLTATVNREANLSLSLDHVRFLLDRKLAPLGITTHSDGSLPAVANPIPPLSLRLKTPLISPGLTWALGGLFTWLFRRPVVAAAIAASVAVEAWILATAPVGSAFAEMLGTPGSVLLVFLLALLSAFFHEIGHASACRYGGVRPGAIGVGVYLVWPVFYTDVTSSYRLGRGGRLRIDLAGVYFNGLVVGALGALYAVTGLPVLLVAILLINVEMLQQLLPFLRFDGYYVVSDLIGVPDLFRYMGPILRRHLLRQEPDQRLGALKLWPQRLVTAWVLVVVPALAAQLLILGWQMPDLIAALGQSALAVASGTSFVEVMDALVQTLLLALPVVAVLAITAPLVGKLIRGRRLTGDTGDADLNQKQFDRLGDGVRGAPSRPAAPAPLAASALAHGGLAAAVVLLLAAGLLSLQFVGDPTIPLAQGTVPSASASLPDEAPHAQQAVTAEPAQLGFGDLPVGTVSAERVVTVRNTGRGALEMGAARLSGADSSDFVVARNDCTGTTLPAGGQCAIGVTFLPAAPGFRASELTLDSGPRVLTVPLKGEASTPTTRRSPEPTLHREPTLAAPRPSGEPPASSPPGATTKPAVSNSGIVFNSWRDGNVEIYTMNPDGSSVARVTDNPANDWWPKWSPDRTRIAFHSDRSGDDDIYSVNADGTGLVQLTTDAATDAQPDWSPDGSRIVFSSTRGGGAANLYVMNADGTAVTRITDGPWVDVAPSWSPDGSRIAFASSRDGNYEIYVVNADGSGFTRVTDDAAADYDPSWSPDGTKLAFWSDRDGNGEIYVINADGNGLTRLTLNLVADGVPSWSPDGTMLAFQTNRDGNPEIYVMPATGDGLLGLLAKRITNATAPDGVPDW